MIKEERLERVAVELKNGEVEADLDGLHSTRKSVVVSSLEANGELNVSIENFRDSKNVHKQLLFFSASKQDNSLDAKIRNEVIKISVNSKPSID